MSSLIGVAVLLFGLILLALNVSCFVLPVLIWKTAKAGDKDRQKTQVFLLASALILSLVSDWLVVAAVVGLSRIDS